MKKRLLAAIMSLCMIVSLLPVSTLAYEGEEGLRYKAETAAIQRIFMCASPAMGQREIPTLRTCLLSREPDRFLV